MDLAAPTAGRILLVGSGQAASELEALLTGQPWQCACTPTPSGVLRRLRAESDIDLVLLAPESSPDSYIQLCRHIKFDPRTALVSVIFALRPAQARHRADVFAAGADDCIQLPTEPGEIVPRLSNAFRIKRATDSLEDATAVISSLANAIEGRDSYTRGHVERVGTYSVEIGRRVGVDADSFSVLRTAGVVHDIGKVAVPDHILNKPGRLTAEEMDIVKRHPVVGYDILKPLRTFRDVLPIVRWHHERPNGTGYPDGLAGDQLPLLPRVVAVADVFDALSTARPYHPALPPEEYRETLARAAANEDLDPVLVATLLDILDERAATLVGTSSDPVIHGSVCRSQS